MILYMKVVSCFSIIGDCYFTWRLVPCDSYIRKWRHLCNNIFIFFSFRCKHFICLQGLNVKNNKASFPHLWLCIMLQQITLFLIGWLQQITLFLIGWLQHNLVFDWLAATDHPVSDWFAATDNLVSDWLALLKGFSSAPADKMIWDWLNIN